MSFILLGILNSQAAGAGGPAYYISLIGSASDDLLEYSFVGADGTLATNGRQDGGPLGSSDFMITKQDADGTLLWAKAFGGGGAEYGYRVGVDDAGNVYASGRDSGNFVLAIFDTDGNLSAQYSYDQGAYDQATAFWVEPDGSYYYIGGLSNSPITSRNSPLMIKADASDGSIVWQRSVTFTSQSGLLNNVHVDSSGNVYALGNMRGDVAIGQDALIVKYNSSGTLQWQRIMGDASSETFYGAVTDSSGNVYVVGSWNDGTRTGGIVLKYNSSGTVQWQNWLYATTSLIFRGIAIDSSDNLYVTGHANSGSGNDVVFAKINSSGTLQFQRTISGSGDDLGVSINILNDSDVYIGAYTNTSGEGGNDRLTMCLPADGSLTGTYTLDGADYVYAASSLTYASATATTNTPSYSDNAGAATVGTPTYTISAATAVQYIETL